MFFPWGFAHRGYRLPDPDARPDATHRATRAVSLLMGSVIAVGTWGGHALHGWLRSGDPSPDGAIRALALPLGVLVLAFTGYAFWVSRFVEGLLPSDLQVTREERMRDAAEVGSPRAVVWCGVALAAGSLGLVALEPRVWWLGALGAALGAGLAVWGRALDRVARQDRSRRPIGPTSSGSPGPG